MLNPETVQLKINNAVLDYKRLFPVEYQDFLKAMKTKRDLHSDKFATVKGDHVLYRPLFEWPEKMQNLLTWAMEPEEWTFFDDKKNVKWFLKTYPEFRVPEKL